MPSRFGASFLEIGNGPVLDPIGDRGKPSNVTTSAMHTGRSRADGRRSTRHGPHRKSGVAAPDRQALIISALKSELKKFACEVARGDGLRTVREGVEVPHHDS